MQKTTVEVPVTDRWKPTPYVRVAVGKRVFLALREYSQRTGSRIK